MKICLKKDDVLMELEEIKYGICEKTEKLEKLKNKKNDKTEKQKKPRC